LEQRLERAQREEAPCVEAAAAVRLHPREVAAVAPLFPFPAAVLQARRGASEPQGEWVVVLPLGAPAAWDAQAVRLQVAEHAVGALPQAAEHAVVGPPRVGAGVRVAVAEEEVVAQWVAPGEAVPPPEVPGAPAVRPSEAVWAFHRDPTPPWPAPSPAVRSERAMEQRPVAAP
jgi:hypothetical protein